MILAGGGWALLAVRYAHFVHLFPHMRIQASWVPSRERANAIPGYPSARYFRLLEQHTRQFYEDTRISHNHP